MQLAVSDNISCNARTVFYAISKQYLEKQLFSKVRKNTLEVLYII